ncbi:MAG: hypothetical protein P1V20_29435 [Verrucomicrobiales bacterium]|nr:hypothetical protein [Verrucomicrobiales bacterium]
MEHGLRGLFLESTAFYGLFCQFVVSDWRNIRNYEVKSSPCFYCFAAKINYSKISLPVVGQRYSLGSESPTELGYLIFAGFPLIEQLFFGKTSVDVQQRRFCSGGFQPPLETMHH